MVLQLVAIALASIAGMALGVVWFAGPVMGTQWRAAAGLAPASAPPGWVYPVALLLTIITAAVLSAAAHIAYLTIGGSFLMVSIVTGLVGWLGFTLSRSGVEYLFERRPLSIFIIDMGHQLVVIVAMAAIIGAFGV